MLQPDQRAELVDVTPTVFEELDRPFERHPAGDELVCLLSGGTTVVLDHGGREESVELTRAGEYVVIPKGTWHIARTSQPTRLLFVTPGEGTEHRPA